MWWAGAGLAAYALLPWSRGTGPAGRAATGLTLAGWHWAAAGVGVALVLAVFLAPGRETRRAGRALAAVAGGGTLLALAMVLTSKDPFGVGALGTAGSLLTVTGLGLARAQLVRGDRKSVV